MCQSCGVAFSHTIHVFFNENGVKKVRSHGLLLHPSAYAWPFIAVDCWRPEISCWTEESFWVMEKIKLTSCQLIHIKRRSAEYKINGWKVIFE